MNSFYTYAFLREDKTPYYIGKGKGDRYYRKRYSVTKPPKDKNRILILKRNLTEEEAFNHEVYMIAVYGRKDIGTGILHNRSNGGEGNSGLIHTEEWKMNHSNLMKENNPMSNPNVRKKHKKSMEEKDWSERNNKVKETNMERYNTSCGMNIPEVRNKHKRKCPYNCKDNHFFDAGNFSNHMMKKHDWTKQQIEEYKNEN